MNAPDKPVAAPQGAENAASDTEATAPMSRAERRARDSPREQRAKERKRKPNLRPANKQNRPRHVMQIPD